jgi:hypothetical protein
MWWSHHEAIKNVIQAVAILIAGVWNGGVCIFDNWLAERLERPFARLSVEIVESGALSDAENYLRIKIVASNISKRRLFTYGNALTVWSVSVAERMPVADPMVPLGDFINDQTNQQRPWVYETSINPDTSDVLAYSQYMSQGYRLRPAESYTNIVTVLVPKDVVMVSLSGRLTLGLTETIFDQDRKAVGGLAIDQTGDLAACAKRWNDKRKYHTPCTHELDDTFYVRSAYADHRARG